MSYSGIAILAFVLNFIINYDILRSIPAKKVAAQSAYRKFLFHVMIFFVADALWGILYEHKLLVSTYIDTIIYFVSMTLTILYWTRYVGEYIDNKSNICYNTIIVKDDVRIYPNRNLKRKEGLTDGSGFQF